MSGLYAVSSGLGLYDPREEAPETEEEAAGYIREKWEQFLNLWSRILDLQHRATLAKQASEAVGDTERALAAEIVFDDLGYLGRWHNDIVYRIEAFREGMGLGAIEPITLSGGVIGITVLALLVAWSFRRFAAQERALEAIEAGTVTAEQLIEMRSEDPPVRLVSGLAELLKWGAIAVVGFMLLRGVQAFRPNPPLMLFHANPPDQGGEISNDVVAIWYRHNEDGELYEHRFERSLFDGVHMDAEPDGSISLYNPDKPVWDDFA